eukprot:352202-Chlamydomonas_euryale.AAC.4
MRHTQTCVSQAATACITRRCAPRKQQSHAPHADVRFASSNRVHHTQTCASQAAIACAHAHLDSGP